MEIHEMILDFGSAADLTRGWGSNDVEMKGGVIEPRGIWFHSPSEEAESFKKRMLL